MAYVTLPENLVDGQVARASQVMANFQAILDQLNGNVDTTNIKNGAVTSDKLFGLISADKIGTGLINNTRFNHLGDVIGPIQAQLDKKASITSVTNLQKNVPLIFKFRASTSTPPVYVSPAGWTVVRLGTGHYEIRTTLPLTTYNSATINVSLADSSTSVYVPTITAILHGPEGDLYYRISVRTPGGTGTDGPIVHTLVFPY